MKNIYRFLAALIFILGLTLIPLKGVSAATPNGNQQHNLLDDRVVFGQTFILEKDQTQNGNLTIMGGTVTLEKGSKVNGDVVLLGGTLTAQGEITGNLNSLGGSIFLEDTSVISGNLNMLGGSVQRSDGAQILGNVVDSALGSTNSTISSANSVSGWTSGLKPIFNFFGKIINSFIIATLAIFIVLLWPKYSERVADAIGAKPLITGGLGLLTIIVLPALLILLFLTIILIPVSLLGVLCLAIALLYGWVAVGLEIGGRILQMFKTKWHPALEAGLGTLVLSLLAGFIGSIPCVGWIVPFVIGLIGLGGVIITRGGTIQYPQLINVTPIPPTPTPAPVAPTTPPIPPAAS